MAFSKTALNDFSIPSCAYNQQATNDYEKKKFPDIE